jgi:hypothetical protein
VIFKKFRESWELVWSSKTDTGVEQSLPRIRAQKVPDDPTLLANGVALENELHLKSLKECFQQEIGLFGQAYVDE